MMMILLSQGRHGIPNVSNELSPCYAHRGETGTKKSAQVLTQKIGKCPFTLLHPGVKHCPLDPGIKPQPLVYSAVHWPTSHKLLSLNSATGLQCSALTNQPQTPVTELSHWFTVQCVDQPATNSCHWTQPLSLQCSALTNQPQTPVIELTNCFSLNWNFNFFVWDILTFCSGIPVLQCTDFDFKWHLLQTGCYYSVIFALNNQKKKCLSKTGMSNGTWYTVVVVWTSGDTKWQ